MKALLFHPDISNEIKGSFDWYEEKSQGLGVRFVTELESAYEAISYSPHTWSPFENEFQRYILAKFPFSVIYKEENESVFIIAVMHNSRKPNYWLERS